MKDATEQLATIVGLDHMLSLREIWDLIHCFIPQT